MPCLGTVFTSQVILVFELWAFWPDVEAVTDVAFWCFGALVLVFLLDHIVDWLLALG